MKITEIQTLHYIETTKPKFKVDSINDEVQNIELYKGGDYYHIETLSQKELVEIVAILISEYLKISCSDFING